MSEGLGSTKLGESTEGRYICPKCGEKLAEHRKFLMCFNDHKYPIVSEVPIIIDDEKSVFRISQFVANEDTTWNTKKGLLRRLIRIVTPEVSHNIRAKRNFEMVAEMLSQSATVLVLGGGVRGPGTDVVYKKYNVKTLSTDVFISDHVDFVSDAHDIPLTSNTIDLVIIQSVLEHVLDPVRCVSEIYRVLKNDGIVYAETPFIQQVHMKEYDFTRFTDLGHRRLFRNFEEIERGSTGGPGMALAWSYRAFVRSFTSTPWIRSALTIFAHWTSFFLKYFDYYLIDKSGASEGSSQYYFIGKKSTSVLSDQELLRGYKGVRW